MIVMHEAKKIELTPEKLADAAAVLLALAETMTETVEETLEDADGMPEEEERELLQLNEEAVNALMVGIAACKVLMDAMRKREEAGADDATAAQ